MAYDSRYQLNAYPVHSYGSIYNIAVTAKASYWFDKHSYVAYAYQNPYGGYTWDSGNYYAMTASDGVLYYHNGTLEGYTSDLGSFLLRAYFFSTASAAANALASDPNEVQTYTYVQVNYPAVTTNYTLTFNSNGATSGSLERTSVSVVSGATITLPDNGSCEKSGYETDGWANSANGTKAYDFNQSFTVTGDKTFYLHWVANVYNMSVTATTGGTATVSSATVTAGDSVTYTATPSTNYAFSGWYNNGNLVATNNPYTFVPTGDTTLQAVFEDISDKASYLIEKVTNRAFALKDGGAAHVTGTPETNHVARWYNSSNTIANGYNFTYASAAPSTQKNGEIYGIRNVSYPADSNWVNGTGRNWGETVYCCIKINFVSETPTTVTLRIQTNSYVTGFDGGIDAQYASWYVKQGSTYLLNQSGVGYTWNATSGGSGYLASGDFYNQTVTINKTNSTQTITFEGGIGATGYTTATVSKSVTIPPSGLTACVGHNGSWKPGNPYVLYNGNWTQASMYIFDGTSFVLSHYRT